MSDALNFVYGVISSTWNWLGSWQYLQVPLSMWLVGFIILDILIMRIFG